MATKPKTNGTETLNGSEPAKAHGAINRPTTLSPFRYPGGKSRLRATVISWMQGLGFRPTHFVEPFAGGASVGLAVAELDLADHVTLAELDPDVGSVWDVVLNGKATAFSER